MAFANAFYTETKYPSADPLKISEEGVKECFKILDRAKK